MPNWACEAEAEAEADRERLEAIDWTRATSSTLCVRARRRVKLVGRY